MSGLGGTEYYYLHLKFEAAVFLEVLHKAAVGKKDSPDCAPCHTTRPLDKKKAAIPSVSCVACHEVGQMVGEGDQARHANVTQPVPVDACRVCHTPDRSPNFVWETYRPRVVH